ncbi:MAG: hypothetical protein WBR26_16535 [Candidatus Acidiferrum sp.]
MAVLFATICNAGQTPQAATIISEKSVDCGAQNKGKKTVKSSVSLVCQQYVVHTSTIEYQIRQPKPAQQELLAPNTPIEFTMDKDKMKFKLNGKKYEFLVVGTSALTTP